jgi:glycosyl transferase family 25
MQIKNFLINLDGSLERYNSAQTQFSENKIDFQRIPAVNGHKLDTNALSDYNAEKTEIYMGRPMTGGEIGCFYSHREALKAFISTDAQYCVIFEDDCLLLENYSETTRAVVEWLEAQKTQWDLVNLSSHERKFFRCLTKIGSRELRQAFYFPMLATAVLWTRNGAIEFLKYHTTVTAPYDNALREWQSHRNRGLTIYPQIVTTIAASSDIDGQDGPRNRIRKSQILYGLRKRRRSAILKWRAVKNMFAKLDSSPRT